MKRIFLDVGGFEGESSRAALDPLFGFDVVYCFEPALSLCEEIRNTINNPRLRIVNAGLLNKTTTSLLYGMGSLGASVYSDASKENAHLDIGSVAFIRASEFFRNNIGINDRVWMKLNCEGSEVAILNDLLDSGEAIKLQEVLVDFDAAKIPSLRSEVEPLEARLTDAPFSYHYPPEVQYGMVTNYGGIRNWLIVSGAALADFRSLLLSMIYQIPLVCDRRFNGYYKIRFLRWLGLRPPPRQISSELRSTWSRADGSRPV